MSWNKRSACLILGAIVFGFGQPPQMTHTQQEPAPFDSGFSPHSTLVLLTGVPKAEAFVRLPIYSITTFLR